MDLLAIITRTVVRIKALMNEIIATLIVLGVLVTTAVTVSNQACKRIIPDPDNKTRPNPDNGIDSASAPPGAEAIQTFVVTIYGKDNCGRGKDVKSIARHVTLSPGVWRINPTGGGWSKWTDDYKAEAEHSKPWAWYFRYECPECRDKDHGLYGPENKWWEYETQKDAEKAARGLQPLVLDVKTQSIVSFWVDDDVCGDNRGAMTLTITRLK